MLRSTRYWSILKPVADRNAAGPYHASFDTYASLQSQAWHLAARLRPHSFSYHRNVTVKATQSSSISCISHRLRRRNSRTVLHYASTQRQQHELASQGKCHPMPIYECMKMQTTLCKKYCREPILISPIGTFSTIQRRPSISRDRPVLYSWRSQNHGHTGPPTRMRRYKMTTASTS
jgi:hypothetical protein